MERGAIWGKGRTGSPPSYSPLYPNDFGLYKRISSLTAKCSTTLTVPSSPASAYTSLFPYRPFLLLSIGDFILRILLRGGLREILPSYTVTSTLTTSSSSVTTNTDGSFKQSYYSIIVDPALKEFCYLERCSSDSAALRICWWKSTEVENFALERVSRIPFPRT